MVAKKAAPRKAVPRNNGARKSPLAAPPAPDLDQRVQALEEQVQKLRMALAQMMLQNPQVQQALAQRMVERGEI